MKALIMKCRNANISLIQNTFFRTKKRFLKKFLYKKPNQKKVHKGVTQNKNYGKINFKKYTKKVHFSESTKYTMVKMYIYSFY